jgi:regulator of replication initiation timing
MSKEELEAIVKDLNYQLDVMYDRLQSKIEENIILVAELDDARKQLERALV